MLIRRIRYWFSRNRRQADLRAEMELHIAETAAELQERGLTESDAHTEARRRFGNPGLKQEDSREVWIAQYWSDFWQDLRYGIHGLRARPAFAIAAVLALALGIGANAIVFNVYNTLAFAPWAIREPQAAVQLWAERGRGNWRGVSWPHFRYLREHMQSLSGLAAFSGNEFRITQGEASWNAEVVTTSENYFDVIGTGFAAGRGFSREAGDLRSPAPEAVLQYETWRTRFGGATDVVGQRFTVGGHEFRVVGVAARGFHGAAASQTNLWIPGAWEDILRPDQNTLENPKACCVSVIGRLNPGTTRVRAQAELNTLSDQFHASVAQPVARVLLTAPSFLANPGKSSFFLTLLIPISTACLLILVLACANVSNLQLARLDARRREIAVRLAIGASRGRVLRQMFVESLLLSCIAGAASVVVSAVVPAWLFQTIAAGESLTFTFANDYPVLAFILVATVAAAMLFGLVPALHGVRAAASGMREETRSTAAGRIRGLLLTVQVALCVVLLCGTVVLVRALNRVQHMDTGFQATNLLLMKTGLDTSGATDEQGSTLVSSLIGRVASLPGVESVALGLTVPLDENAADTKVVDPQTHESVEVGMNTVSSNFFEVLQIPVIEGRAFAVSDELNRGVIIVNQAAARRFWPGQSAVGQTLEKDGSLQVVGVVPDITTSRYGLENDPFVWFPAKGNLSSKVVIRYSGLPASLVKDLPLQARSLDRRFLATVAPYSVTIDAAQRSYRITAVTGSVLGALALLLAWVGIHGVAAYNASRRMRELGIRVALGARPRAILAMMFKQNLRAVTVGAVVGLVAAIGFGYLLTNLLYGVKPVDPVAMLLTLSVLLAAATAAVWGPARRSSCVDPAVTLRNE